MAKEISMADFLELNNLAFEWADSYDNKDWDRLHAILAPKITLDMRALQMPLQEGLTASEYVAQLTQILGDKRMKTQHFLGRGKTTVLDDGSVRIDHQIRVAHQRHKTEDMFSEVVNKGHGHGVTTHWYRKVDGAWKLEKVAPTVTFTEFDLFGTLNPKEE